MNPKLLVIWSQIVDVLTVLFHWTSGPIVPLIEGISKIDASVGMNPQIIWPLQLFPPYFWTSTETFPKERSPTTGY
jgi:hypothetical protein